MSMIAEDVEGIGTLRTQEPLEIHGEFRGRLTCQSQLTIGPSGSVEAEVEAPRVVIHGQYRGNLLTSRRLEILAGARFRGQMLIQPEVLVISSKVQFDS